jgi:hypothetical protein
VGVNICELQTLELLCDTETNGLMTISRRIDTGPSAVANSYYCSAKAFFATFVSAIKNARIL